MTSGSPSKKTPYAPQRDRPDVVEERARFVEKQDHLISLLGCVGSSFSFSHSRFLQYLFRSGGVREIGGGSVSMRSGEA
jgi:excinuclease UvrABC helicase subunit UvrB